MKLTKKDLRKWVKALRSGEYTQAGGRLCVSYEGGGGEEKFSFCCLGVACDIFLDADWEEETGFWRLFWSISEHSKLPPPPLKDAIDAALPARCSCDRLTLINDNGATFDEIASLIEEAAEL